MLIPVQAIDQELWAHKLMDHIMGCDHTLGWKEVLKFIYCFMILFLKVYIFKHFYCYYYLVTKGV
jgi:hypothetical protein